MTNASICTTQIEDLMVLLKNVITYFRMLNSAKTYFEKFICFAKIFYRILIFTFYRRAVYALLRIRPFRLPYKMGKYDQKEFLGSLCLGHLCVKIRELLPLLSKSIKISFY